VAWAHGWVGVLHRLGTVYVGEWRKRERDFCDGRATITCDLFGLCRWVAPHIRVGTSAAMHLHQPTNALIQVIFRECHTN
jgi:hypothetical protein